MTDSAHDQTMRRLADYVEWMRANHVRRLVVTVDNAHYDLDLDDPTISRERAKLYRSELPTSPELPETTETPEERARKAKEEADAVLFASST